MIHHVWYFESDHKAVQLLVTTGELMKKEPVTVFDFQTMDIKRFNLILTERLTAHVLPKDRDITVDEIDEAVFALTEAYSAAMSGSIKKLTLRGRFLPRLPDEILDLIRQKKTLRRRMDRTSDYNRKIIFRAEIRNLTRIIDQRISKFEQDFHVKRLNDVRLGGNMHKSVKVISGLVD